jgi:hypothetical protein
MPHSKIVEEEFIFNVMKIFMHSRPAPPYDQEYGWSGI